MSSAPEPDDTTRDGRVKPMFEYVPRRPQHPALQPHVRSLGGYSEWTLAPLRRREFPGPQVVVIIELGPPIAVVERKGGERRHFRTGFVAGMDDQFTLTEHAGFQTGIQLNLTPLGAARLFAMPMRTLLRQVVELDDVLAGSQRGFAEHLATLPEWSQRLDAVENWLLHRLNETQVPPLVDHAVACVLRDGMNTRELARHVGYSQKHTIALFHEYVGVTPRALHRLARFERTLKQIRAGAPNWAGLANDLGYCDQAHLIREFRRYTGMTPSAVAAGRETELLGQMQAAATSAKS